MSGRAGARPSATGLSRLAAGARELFLEGFGSLLELIRRHIFHMSRNAPGIAKWVLDSRGAVAIECVFRCSDRRRTRLERARIGGVNVIDIDIQRIDFGRPLWL